jgi:hypothetical protein
MTPTRFTAVAIFDTHAHADEAVEELYRRGFRPDQVGLVAQRTKGMEEKSLEGTLVEGAGIGVLVGASLGGLLAGAGAAPGAAAGGLLMGLLEGGVVGGALGALIGMGVPEKEAHYYQKELEGGHTIVAVNSDRRYEEAEEVLRRHGGRPADSPLAHVGPGVLP